MKLTSTPWGHPQQQHEIGDGIFMLSTSSHGGIFLTPERWHEFRQQFPTFQPFAGQQWLEEDCDAALAALVWPECFQDHHIAASIDMVTHYRTSPRLEETRGDYFAEPKAWLQTPAAREVMGIHARHKAKQDDKGKHWREVTA